MSRILVGVVVLVGLVFLPGCSFLPIAGNAANSDLTLLICGLTNCPEQMFRCLMDPDCRATLECNARCGSSGTQGDQQACHLVCQLGQGEMNETYRQLVQCFAENGCLPKLPEGKDGQCLVTSESIQNVYVLQSLDEIRGTWLEIRGLNCGVPGSNWEGGYDALPCRSSSWVYSGQQWWYVATFCAPGEAGSCGTNGPVHLVAQPSLSRQEPGLIDVDYVNPPLQPQIERWYILSKPDPDWIMYTYCGSTPVGAYAGVNVITRIREAADAAVPLHVEAAFRETAAEFNFSYDDMCITEQAQCPSIAAEDYVQNRINGALSTLPVGSNGQGR